MSVRPAPLRSVLILVLIASALVIPAGTRPSVH